MSLADQYQEAFREIKRSYPGISDAEADAQARQFLTPAGDTEYATNELIDKGGFIGDPNVPGSNVFNPEAQPNRATGTVQLAGQALNLPGTEPYLKSYQADIVSGVPEKEAELRNLYPYNEQEKHMALVRGAYGEVPEKSISELDKQWEQASNLYRKLVTQDQVDYQQADVLALEPVRRRSIELASEYKYRPAKAPEPLSRVEWQQLSDARIRLRKAESDLQNPLGLMQKRIPKATVEKEAADARAIIRALESKAGGLPTEVLTAGAPTATGTSFAEGQRVRNRRTGQMGTVRNGVVVPD